MDTPPKAPACVHQMGTQQLKMGENKIARADGRLSEAWFYRQAAGFLSAHRKARHHGHPSRSDAGISLLARNLPVTKCRVSRGLTGEFSASCCASSVPPTSVMKKHNDALGDGMCGGVSTCDVSGFRSVSFRVYVLATCVSPVSSLALRCKNTVTYCRGLR